MMIEEFGLDEGEATEEIGKRQAVAQEKARENQEPLADHGEVGNGRKVELTKSENVNSTHQGGNSSDYRIRKLRRDFPEVAAKLDRGEFKSVAAAERHARGEEP
jgi:hypothetical protein